MYVHMYVIQRMAKYSNFRINSWFWEKPSKAESADRKISTRMFCIHRYVQACTDMFCTDLLHRTRNARCRTILFYFILFYSIRLFKFGKRTRRWRLVFTAFRNLTFSNLLCHVLIIEIIGMNRKIDLESKLFNFEIERISATFRCHREIFFSYK